MNIHHAIVSWHSRLKTSLCLFSAIVLAFAAGCGTTEIPNSGTAADASKMVTTVLEAWVAGKTPDDLKTGTPVINVSDVDWQEGRTLKAFKLSDSPLDNGNYWRVPAVLTLSVPGRGDVQQLAAYNVTLKPSVIVGRADDGHIRN